MNARLPFWFPTAGNLGGIFNVNPAQTNGPANSITPKCDFTVKSDDAGTIMLHWIPTWNYADMSKAPSSQFGLFQTGSFYQGMRVCPLVSPEQFLLGLLQQERPNASNLRIVTKTPIPEIVKAFTSKYAQVNATLRQSGLAPLSFDVLAS
jgi:hypothetical protein